MATTISPQTKRDLLPALRERYQQASRIEKARILDEYVALAKCHRKHAIRLLTDADSVDPTSTTSPAHDRRTYDEAVREALTILWEAADRTCGKRLQVVLSSLVGAMERHKHLAPRPGGPVTRARGQPGDHRPGNGTARPTGGEARPYPWLFRNESKV